MTSLKNQVVMDIESQNLDKHPCRCSIDAESGEGILSTQDKYIVIGEETLYAGAIPHNYIDFAKLCDFNGYAYAGKYHILSKISHQLATPDIMLAGDVLDQACAEGYANDADRYQKGISLMLLHPKTHEGIFWFSIDDDKTFQEILAIAIEWAKRGFDVIILDFLDYIDEERGGLQYDTEPETGCSYLSPRNFELC